MVQREQSSDGVFPLFRFACSTRVLLRSKVIAIQCVAVALLKHCFDVSNMALVCLRSYDCATVSRVPIHGTSAVIFEDFKCRIVNSVIICITISGIATALVGGTLSDFFFCETCFCHEIVLAHCVLLGWIALVRVCKLLIVEGDMLNK